MNLHQELILLKNEDKTESIISYRLAENSCEMIFAGGSRYFYSRSNVRVYTHPRILDAGALRVYHDGALLTGVKELLDFGEYIRLFFDRRPPCIYPKNELRFEQNCLQNTQSQSILSYFRKIADVISLRTEEDVKILVKQYEKLLFVADSTALASYLEPAGMQKKAPHSKCGLIYPFGLNQSQQQALERAFSAQCSIIEGPPGTGKTQTILNIIANAVLQNKTVAVVSNNHAATKNVMEKLEKYGLAFLTAYLGNAKNKREFITAQSGCYPDMRTWKLPDRELSTLYETLLALGRELGEMLSAQNRAAQLEQMRADMTREQHNFETYYREIDEGNEIRQRRKRPSQEILQLWLQCEDFAERGRRQGFWIKAKSLLLLGRQQSSFYKLPLEKIIPLLQKLYYELRLSELAEEKQRLEQKLLAYSFAQKRTLLTEQSMRFFKAMLARRYGTDAKRPVFTLDDFWKHADKVNQEYPVILSTTYSIRGCLSNTHIYDYVIIDEASQADLVTGALALSCAYQAVIVGDRLQLPNVLPAQTKVAAQKIWKEVSLPAAYQFEENSLLSSASLVWKEMPHTLLREHYRCHPKIIAFCNQKFYQNQLIIMTADHGEADVLGIYRTAAGMHARGHVNQRQVDVIMKELLPALGDINPDDMGIISPYRDQTDVIKEETSGTGIEIATVHKFQGREKDTIILTTVDNVIGPFADNPNMLNVAVSRAVRRLRVVVSPDERNDNTNIGDLMRYIRYHNFETADSKIYSVFDLLYGGYEQARRDYLKKHKRISQYDSENLAHQMILQVLTKPSFQKLGVVVHQPLYLLLHDVSLLQSDEEYAYAMNACTHVDFLIFHQMDKSPVLAIEVDGAGYHAKGSRQSQRDARKDAILSCYGIPLLRFKTTGSGEEQKLTEKLTQLLSDQQRDPEAEDR